MKATTLSLALCAALALATDVTAPVAAKGTICATGSDFADTADSSDSVDTAAYTATSTATSTTGSEDADDDSTSTDDDDSVGAETTSDDGSADADADAVQAAAASASSDSTEVSVGDASSSDDSEDSESSAEDAGSSAYTQSVDAASTSASSSGSSSGSFTKVTALQARVQGDMPTWNDEYGRFVSAYYDTFEEKYRAVLDTVNMAAVEGALKYVQAECINASVVEDCERKNSIKYVVFYETTVVQPTAAMEYYANATDDYDFAIEHCPFMAMDGGQCDPNEDGSFPDVCNQYIGTDGQPELGFCIGGTLQDNEVLAPYPNNYWFSFPNSCPQELWDDKTSSCREEYAGGMCALGVEPDGQNCTFSYEVLGYILLDDVVGITSMINPLTLDYYADYYEFCEAGGVEFEATVLGDLVTLVEGLTFWANPGSSEANAERAEKLVAAYQALVAENATTTDGGVMQTLPTVADLTALNPPCYENSPVCAEAEFGCKRALYSQICELCESEDDDCVVKP